MVDKWQRRPMLKLKSVSLLLLSMKLLHTICLFQSCKGTIGSLTVFSCRTLANHRQVCWSFNGIYLTGVGLDYQKTFLINNYQREQPSCPSYSGESSLQIIILSKYSMLFS